MSSKVVIITAVSVIILFLLAGGIWWFMASDRGLGITTPTPSPGTGVSPTPAAQASPSPNEENLIRGQISEVSDQPVGFRNSILVTVSQNGTSNVLYVPPTANITTVTGVSLTRDQLREGLFIEAQVSPIEGGFLAEQIRVTTQPTASPSPRAQTPSPSPTARSSP